MLMDICNEAVLRINEIMPVTPKEGCNQILNPSNDVSDQTFVCIIQLEHMRDKKNYIKTIERWCRELEIRGHIIFYGKLKVFLVLLGSEKSLKSFQQQLKTNNVDIDSRGRPCKEKLSTVLCCEVLLKTSRNEHLDTSRNNTEAKQSALKILEAQTIDDVIKCFCDLKLEYLYKKYIGFER